MFQSKRKITRPVLVGGIEIGGGKPIVVQSMTTTKPRDVTVTLSEIQRLADAGCELVRLAVPEASDALALKKIVSLSPLPVIADIHFNHELAIAAAKAGVHKLRINPGTFRSRKKLDELTQILRSDNIPIRVGANSGSVSPAFSILYNEQPAEALVQSTLQYIDLLNQNGVTNIVVSLKSSDVITTVKAYRRFSELSDLPLHIGITEAGPGVVGATRSAVGITLLLSEGIGDTIRVSLTGDPVDEIKACYEILNSLALPHRHPYLKLISCPTCGRISYDLINLISDIEKELFLVKKNASVAIMGCAVNGPGEAREADIGLAGEKGKFLLFKKGKIIGKGLDLDEARRLLIKEIHTL